MNTRTVMLLLLFVILTWGGSAGIAYGVVELTGGESQGEQGPPGPQGPKGASGPQGRSSESAGLDTNTQLTALEQRATDIESFNQYQVCFLDADREDRDAYHQFLAGQRTFEAYQATHEAVLLDERQCLDLYFPY